MTLHFDAAPGPDQLGNPSGGGGSAPGFPTSAASTGSTLSNQAEHVQGLAGSAVTAVTFKFADGSTVDATVQNSWYFVWWPGNSWPTSQVTTSNGTRTSPMSLAACKSLPTGCVFAGWNHTRSQPAKDPRVREDRVALACAEAPRSA